MKPTSFVQTFKIYETNYFSKKKKKILSTINAQPCLRGNFLLNKDNASTNMNQKDQVARPS